MCVPNSSVFHLDVLQFENLDLNSIYSPVNFNELHILLKQTNYSTVETDFLISGFRNGFDLGYRGPQNVRLKSPNLKFVIGDETELWNKVMKEVREKRYAGPFPEIPYKENFIQSPIGLVPKDGGKKTRLIFHLSYPRVPKGTEKPQLSVNANTPVEMTLVTYPDFDQAIRLCISECKMGYCFLGKSDMTSAFRHFAIAKKYWRYLIMKAKNPVDQKFYYFVDKCMPLGAAVSCSHFQRFSNAIAHIVKTAFSKQNINYLDDFWLS